MANRNNSSLRDLKRELREQDELLEKKDALIEDAQKTLRQMVSTTEPRITELEARCKKNGELTTQLEFIQKERATYKTLFEEQIKKVNEHEATIRLMAAEKMRNKLLVSALTNHIRETP